ncbi:MAG: hypothetical protein IKQ20_02855 [Bacteroidales bacterium]|nr:hypothetical protein [Bacteroidales bacterium]
MNTKTKTKTKRQEAVYTEQDIKKANALLGTLSDTDKEKVKREVLKQLVEEFKNSPDAEVATRKMSMSYLLFGIANQYAEEAQELMLKHHIMRKDIKTKANNLMQSFESYNKTMSEMVNTADGHTALCNDTALMGEMVAVYCSQTIKVVRGDYFEPTLFLPRK